MMLPQKLHVGASPKSTISRRASAAWIEPAAGLEAGVSELLAHQFQRDTVLQRDRDGAGKAIHQPADRGSFLGHGDKDLPRTLVRIETDGDVALVSADIEFVSDGGALFRQL